MMVAVGYDDDAFYSPFVIYGDLSPRGEPHPIGPNDSTNEIEEEFCTMLRRRSTMIIPSSLVLS